MISSFEGHRPHWTGSVWIDPAARLIGDVSLGEDSSVWPGAVIRGDMHHIRIGARTSIQDGAVLHVTHDSDFHPGGFPLEIGDDVTIAHQAMLHGCTLGHRVLVGIQAVVMDDVRVDDDVIIAAGSLVPSGKHLQGGWLYRGRPARPVRELTDDERAYLVYVAGNYVRLKDRYLAEAGNG